MKNESERKLLNSLRSRLNRGCLVGVTRDGVDLSLGRGHNFEKDDGDLIDIGIFLGWRPPSWLSDMMEYPERWDICANEDPGEVINKMRKQDDDLGWQPQLEAQVLIDGAKLSISPEYIVHPLPESCFGVG